MLCLVGVVCLFDWCVFVLDLLLCVVCGLSCVFVVRVVFGSCCRSFVCLFVCMLVFR